MCRQFNALKNTRFVLSDFCNDREIETLKKYLDSDGNPLSYVPLIIRGQPGPLEEHLRNDDQFQIRMFEGRVMRSDVHRNGNDGFADGALSNDLVHTSYTVDNERFNP